MFNSARFSPDGSRIVTSSWYNTVQVWDAATGKELGILSGDADDHFVDAQFSADGKTIVTESFTEGGGYHAYLWDASTGHRRASLPGYAVRLSRDGEAIVTGTGDTVCVWQTATGNLLTILQAHDDGAASTGFYVSRAEFSPDGTKVVAGSDDKTARVWDVNTGNQILVLRGHAESVGSAHFSQDGKRIVTASQDYTARLWDAATGKELDTLRHDSWVDSAQFSPDGKTIVTISRDQQHATAYLWDAVTGVQLGILRAQRFATDAQFSPDGKMVVVADAVGTAHLYLIGIEELIMRARSLVSHELTCAEHVQYLREARICPAPTPLPTPTLVTP